MNPDTMPPWLIDYLEDNTGFNRPGKFGYPYYTATAESEAVVDFYDFISKPENAAKICPNCKEQNEKNSEE